MFFIMCFFHILSVVFLLTGFIFLDKRYTKYFEDILRNTTETRAISGMSIRHMEDIKDFIEKGDKNGK